MLSSNREALREHGGLLFMISAFKGTGSTFHRLMEPFKGLSILDSHY